MTPERAQYVIANRLPYGGLRMAFRRCEDDSHLVYEDGITVSEDESIRALWRTMPGYTCYMDALARIARGEVPAQPAAVPAQPAAVPGERFHLDATDDGGALVVDEDGEVIAKITPEGWVPPPWFARAMKALDPNFDPEACGHG